MHVLIVYLLWILFSIYEGKREAYYYSFKMRASIRQHKGYKNSENEIFVKQRIFVGIISVMAANVNLIDFFIIAISLFASFPFLNDGSYYVTRKKLDGIYRKGWFDTSVSSLHSTNPKCRIAGAVFSLCAMVYEIIFYWK